MVGLLSRRYNRTKCKNKWMFNLTQQKDQSCKSRIIRWFFFGFGMRTQSLCDANDDKMARVVVLGRKGVGKTGEFYTLGFIQ